MQTTMRGLVKEVAGPGDLVYHDDLPIPVIGDDEVLVKVHCTAICGSDIHMLDWDEWSRKRLHPPVILGHETAGDIVAVGKHVADRKIGDRVSVETHISCGECYFCRNNMPHICSNMVNFGVAVDSAFAEYFKIRSDCTFLLDDGISYEAACMFEPMGAGVHGVEAAEVQDKVVLVSGCGAIGLTAISACKVFGARYVIACDLLDSRLELAREMGADAVFNSSKVTVHEEVRRLTDGHGCDAAIDITGAEVAINSALKSLRAAGKLVCVGLPSKPITLEDMADDLVYREITLTGVSGRLIWDTWTDFGTVMKSPYYKLEKLIGGRFSLEDYETAFRQVRDGVPGKVLLYPQGVSSK